MVQYSISPQWNDAAAQQWAISNLGQNIQPGGGAIINAARDAGKLDLLQQDMASYQNPTPNQGGFVPATIDPIHQYTKAGLQQLAEPPAYGQGSMAMANQYLQNLLNTTQPINPMADQYLQEAGGMVSGSAAPITMEDIEAIRNPYSQALQDRLTEQGRQARAAILAHQGTRGGQSFGDTSQGVRESYLDAEMLRGRQDIDFNTYESAISQLQNQRGRELQAGNTMGNLGATAQNVTGAGVNNALNLASGVFGSGKYLTELGRQNASDQIEAGEFIRRYNQSVNDQIAANILGEANYEPQQLATVQNLLAGFQSGTGYTPMSTPSTLTRIGGGATALSGYLNTPTVGNLPWTTPGNVNPSGGYYF